MGSLGADECEDLEDGARASTPEGDNLLLDFARAEAAAYGALVASSGGRVADDVVAGAHLRDLGVGAPYGNPAFLARPIAEHEAADTLDAISSWYAQADGGPFLVFSPWPTGDWRAHGLHPVGHPPLMFRPVGPTPPPAEGVAVERVADAETLAAWEQTFLEAYPVPEMLPYIPRSFVGPSILDTGWTLLLARVDGEPVATAGVYVTPTVSAVELVATRPRHRGRQLGTAVTAAASTVAGDRPAMLISSDLGRHVYERLGYLPVLRYTLWLGQRERERRLLGA